MRLYKHGSRWALFRWTDVRSQYIKRLHLLKTPWFAICLHWILTPDPEPYLHDHPVSFLSLILRGGYAELRRRGGAVHHEVHRWYNRVHASHFDQHRIIFVRKHTLTLCFMGPVERTWGYHLDERTWVSWQEYERLMKLRPLHVSDFDPRFVKERFDDAETVFNRMLQRFNSEVAGKPGLIVDEDVRQIDDYESYEVVS